MKKRLSVPKRRNKGLSLRMWTVHLISIVLALISAFVSLSYAEVLTLPQGLRLAQEGSRLIKINQEQEKISEGDTLIAKSALLPSINASANQTFFARQPYAVFGSFTVPTSEKNFPSYSLSIQQLLYDFGGTISRYRSTKAILETRKLDTVRVRNFVSLDFALVYFDLLEAEKLVRVAESEVRTLEAHLRDAKNLYENGVITKNDLLQAEVRLSDARQKVLNTRNLRAINASRLNTVLSRSLNTDVQVMDVELALSGYTVLERGEAFEVAVQERPEVRILDETMMALDLEEKSRKAEYYPRFFAGASYDYADNRYQLHEANASLVLGMSLNLFSGGSTRAELIKTEYRRRQLLEQKARIEDEVRLEVEKNLLDLSNARERMKVAKDAVGQAEENLRINRVRYEEGVGTATEVLDAVTLLTTAETNHYRALYDFRRAEASAFYSMGKDLVEVYK
jgi:outer membrane protein TolC